MARKNIQVERLDQLKLRDYQQVAVDMMRAELEASAGILLADDLGLGKTLMIVETIRAIKPKSKHGRMRVLYIAPNVTHLQVKKTFLRQFRTLDPDKVRLVGPHGASGTKYDAETWRRMKKKEPGVFIIGPEHMAGALGYEVTASGEKRKWAPTQANILKAMRDGRIPPWHLTGIWDLVVFDEVHRANNRKNTLIGKVLRLIKAHARIGASATPAGNKEENLWFILNWLWRKEYGAFWQWINKHFRTVDDEYGWDPVEKTPKVRKVIAELMRPAVMWSEIPCAIRRESKDILNLPDVIVHEIEVGMTAVQREMYDDLEEQAFTWMGDVPVGTPYPMVKQLRMRQIALGETLAEENEMTLRQAASKLKITVEALQKRIDQGEEFDLSKLDVDYKNMGHPKVHALKELLEDLPENEPVLVLTHSAKFADVVAKQIGKSARRWALSSDPERQEELKKGFGIDYRILIAVISGIGTGVDSLQDRGCIEVWLSQDQNGVNNEQAKGRLYRSGQTRPVQRYYIRTEGTIDDDVYADALARGDRMALMYGDKKKEES